MSDAANTAGQDVDFIPIDYIEVDGLCIPGTAFTQDVSFDLGMGLLTLDLIVHDLKIVRKGQHSA